MKNNTGAIRRLRWGLVGVGLFLPLLSLVPIGSLWLWQNGWLLIWGLLASAMTLSAWLAQRWLLGGLEDRSEPEPIETTATPADPGWTAAETAAWDQVRKIASSTEPEQLTSTDAVLDLGRRTLEAAARSLHPDKTDPVFQFTAPEALALVQRVSQRLQLFVRDQVPMGDRLTIAQVLALWRQRGLIETAEKAYDIWRVIRVLNPATALASEVRERIQSDLYQWGRQHVAKRLVTVYVEEVGRAAIDLYGGRLRLAPGDVEAYVSPRSAGDLVAAKIEEGQSAEPLRILVAGQISAGKSSLINALAEEVKAAVDVLPTTDAFRPYRIEKSGLPAALFLDSPGLSTSKQERAALIEQAVACDMLLWVCAANRADRSLDAEALAAIRDRFATSPNRRRPPIVLIATHVDRLRPFQEWSPPYDLERPDNRKAVSIREAVQAAAGDLGFRPDEVIPVCLDSAAGRYNVDALWGRIMEQLPEAQRTRLVRILREAEAAWNWRRIWQQVRSGGRILVGGARGGTKR